MGTGFELLNEMSDKQLIAEVLRHQQKCLEGMDRETLLQHVINLRLAEYRDRLFKEANVEQPNGFGLFQ